MHDVSNPRLFTAHGKDFRFLHLKEALVHAGVTPGATVFVHSDIGRFGALAEVRQKDVYTGYFLKALLEAIGEEGTLLMPTFTYSFCKNEVFDPAQTASTVGILTEFFRKRAEVERSLEGIFSVAAFGPRAKYFTNVGLNCFGRGSVFEKLYLDDALILFMGETFDLTFMHFIEHEVGVTYRYNKEFPGKIKIADELVSYTFNYFVRDLEINVVYDLENIAEYLSAENALTKVGVGASKIRKVSTKKTFEVLAKGLKRDSKLLIKKDLLSGTTK